MSKKCHTCEDPEKLIESNVLYQLEETESGEKAEVELSEKEESRLSIEAMADEEGLAAYELALYYARIATTAPSRLNIASDLKRTLKWLNVSAGKGYVPASYKLYRVAVGKAKLSKLVSLDTNFGGGLCAGSTIVWSWGIKGQEVIRIGQKRAKEYLSLVTNNEATDVDEAVGNSAHFDLENQLFIKGKIAWAEEYSEGGIVASSFSRAANLACYIFESLEASVVEHLNNIDGMKVNQVNREQHEMNYFFLDCMSRLEKVFLSLFKEGSGLVSRDCILRCLVLVAKLTKLPDLINLIVQKEKEEQAESELSVSNGLIYSDATRDNPDGTGQRADTSDDYVKDPEQENYKIDYKALNLYQVYQEISRSPEFQPDQIRAVILSHDSVESLMGSRKLEALKNDFLNVFLPNLGFMSYYCVLLSLNGQQDKAKELYESTLFSYKNILQHSQEFKDPLQKLGNLVSATHSIKFDEYKNEVASLMEKNNPCLLYEHEISLNRFSQRLFEKCWFKKASKGSRAKDAKPLIEEMLEYIGVLSNGGEFLGFEVSADNEQATHLFKRLADEAVSFSEERNEMEEINSPYDTVTTMLMWELSHIPYGDEPFCEPLYKRYSVKVPFQAGRFPKDELSNLELDSEGYSKVYTRFHVVEDGSEESFELNQGDQRQISSELAKLYSRLLINYISHQKNPGDKDFRKYISALAFFAKNDVHSSDFNLLAKLLYKREQYQAEVYCDFGTIRDMTSSHNPGGYDFYFANEKIHSKIHRLPYDYPDGLIYPINYAARLNFNQFFSKKIESTHQGVLSDNNPFNAYESVVLLKMVEVWRINNAPILNWLASKTFRELKDSPYHNPDELADSNVKNIINALRNKQKDIDFSKAVEIDSFQSFSANAEEYFSVATDGGIKIPEMLFMRALLYLDDFHLSTENRKLIELVKQFRDRELSVDVKAIPDEPGKKPKLAYRKTLYPFLESLKNSSEYSSSTADGVTPIRNIKKSLGYLDELLEKNRDGEFFYADHMDLVGDAISLKIELEKELYRLLTLEVNQKKQELAAQKAASEKEHEMLSFLTHTLRNSLANGPEQLKQSIRLLGTDDYDGSNSKYKAINNIVSQLSTFSVVNTLITTFKQYVGDKESFLAQWFKDTEGEADINWVVSFCLRQCVSRALFYPNYQRVIKRLVKEDNSAFIKKARKNYIENILPIADNETPTEIIPGWLGEYLPKLEIDIEDNSPRFAVNNIKYTFLFSIFSELIWNAFKNADGKHPVQIRWEDKKDHYSFTVKNHYIEDEINLESSTNKGLVFIERLLSLFDGASLNAMNENNIFVVSINLPKHIFQQDQK
jgi:hypothetical protein